MEHSIWKTVFNVLANLVSKFVTRSSLKIKDERTGGYVTVSASLPFEIKSANLTKSGNLIIRVGKENKAYEESLQSKRPSRD